MYSKEYNPVEFLLKTFDDDNIAIASIYYNNLFVANHVIYYK